MILKIFEVTTPDVPTRNERDERERERETRKTKTEKQIER